jgi:DNA primase
MLWIDIKYASMLSNRLEGFAVKKNKPFLAVFRCFYCGDSSKNKSKKRGYIIEKGVNASSLLYYCHNCGASKRFSNALFDIDQMLHKELTLERLKESGMSSRHQKTKEIQTAPKYKAMIEKFGKRKFEKSSALRELTKVSSLPVDHPVKKYVSKRQIPARHHYKLFYAPKFMAWTNTIVPEKFSPAALRNDAPRLVIPFIDAQGDMYAFQGRALDENDSIRYYTIIVDPEKPRIYGLDTVDLSKTTYIMEGPLDSLFLPNAIALAGGDNSDIERVVDKENAVFVFDNESRNKDTVRRIQKAIDSGYQVVIFPESIKSKDINDMIVSEGFTSDQLSDIMVNNTFKGLRANLKLTQWKHI